MPIKEHPQLIEDAFVAYLTNQNPVPWGDDLVADNGEDEGLRIFSAEDFQDKDGNRIVVTAASVGDEDPPCSGNRWAEVTVELRSMVLADGSVSLASHQANANALQALMLSTTLPDQLTAATGNFRCFGVIQRNPYREEGDHYWASGWRIRLLSCPSAMPD